MDDGPGLAPEIDGRGGPGPGAVTLVRHGEPALSRRVRLSAQGYGAWWARYEAGGLKAGQLPPRDLVDAAARSGVILSSTRPRAIETARALVGDHVFEASSLFIEAPLPPPPLPAALKLPPRWWGVISRLCWMWLGLTDRQESYGEAKARARRAAQDLMARAADGDEVMLIAHGFFNLMIGRALQAEGWRLALDQGFSYWSARRFEAARSGALAAMGS